MKPQFELIAKTFQGLEEILAQELIELGADNVQIGRRMVSFTGDKEMMYRANFCLRTAVRILKPIRHFRAADADAVYEAVKSIEWDQYLSLDTTFSVDSVVYSTEFRHSKFVAYKVKDAIADYFREKTGQRPNIKLTNPDIKLNIHIAETDCTLSLDSSGESLHQRGYRVATVEAPINEVLAAAIVRMSGWDYQSDLIDPFCGSGTILVEAALMARNIYPGIFRKEFGFEKWKDFDADMLQRIFDDDSAEREFHHRIYGYDLNLRAVEAATANAKAAGVADCVEVAQRDVRKFAQPAMPAVMVTNPPYGERLASADVLSLYRTLGERLKHQFVGGEAWVICSREECFEQMGLKPSLKTPLYNGSLDCELRKYQIFDGRMQDYRAQGGIVKTDEELRLMAEKKRFKMHREFKQRFSDDSDGELDDMIPGYLKKMHHDFERRRNEIRRPRDSRGDDRRPHDDRRDGDRPRRFGSEDRRFGGEDRRFGSEDRRFGSDSRRPGGYDRGDRRYGNRDERSAGRGDRYENRDRRTDGFRRDRREGGYGRDNRRGFGGRPADDRNKNER